MNLNMMKYLDMKSDNLLSSGMKIVFNNKIYNYFGFSNEREYFVIYSAREEPFFIKGSEFDKTIPISISKNRIDRSCGESQNAWLIAKGGRNPHE